MATLGTLPDYETLPLDSSGARCAWGLFGADDSVGLINLITPATVREATRLAIRGRVFSLNSPINFFDPPLFGRGKIEHKAFLTRERWAIDDVLDNFYPQASSQWDALGHVGVRDDVFYNGATADDVIIGGRNTIDHWASRGIVGRAVVLDIPGALHEAGANYDPGTTFEIGVDELELARNRAGVEFQIGDIALIYTGFFEWYAELDAAGRRRAGERDSLKAAGLAHSEDLVRYLWNSHISAIGTDAPGMESWPPPEHRLPGAYGHLHRVLLGLLGFALGELWWLKDLVDDCASEGLYTALFMSSPMNLPGGIGSPANALAVK